MLWAGMLLTFALAMTLGLGTRRTAWLASLGFGGILFANGLRAAALFYLETGIIEPPAWTSDWLHEGVGLMSFALVGVALVLGTRGWMVGDSRPPQASIPSLNTAFRAHLESEEDTQCAT
jgi:exosortase/archaeosortase family protein